MLATAGGVNDGNTTGDDYTYDDNGNLTVDKNKGILNISYNYLNLPTEIFFGNCYTIRYIYNALGTKLMKKVVKECDRTETSYAGNFQYVQYFEGEGPLVLQFFSQPEGYVDCRSGSAYKYVYQYKDHLGNVRLSYKDINDDGTITNNEIVEESNYYPFGMKHSGYNSNNLQPDYKYKYNGKELQDELGLNEYAYGWRDYDPAIGRWNVVDQLAEKYYKISPYAYVANNPISTIDPDGRYLFGLFGSTSAERKEARAEKYAEKVGGTVVKGENGYVGVNVVKKEADGSNTIVGKTNFGDFATVKGNIKNWTTNHKEQLLKGAELAQKKGNQLALTGLGAAAIGAPVGGVGAGPGLAVATTGKVINELGVLVEIGTKIITQDKGAAGDSVNYIGGKILSSALDNALPGGSSLMPKEVNDAIKIGNMATGNMVDDKMEIMTDKLRDN